MKSYSRRLDQSYQKFSLLTGNLMQAYTAVGATYDDFTVTGFGSNTGRKFVDPVAGEYKKLLWTSKEGYSELSYRNRFTGELTADAYRKIGYHGDEYGDSMASLFPGFYDSTTYNNALSDFYDGVKRSEANLALSIGEARESGRMLKVGKSIYEVILMARRAKRQALMNPSKTISEIWLSYKYGWQPLLNDVYNYLTWSYHTFNDGVKVRGRATRYDEPGRSTKTLSPWPARTIAWRGQRFWKSEVVCWVGIADSSTYQLSRITSLNPLSIAWELVPLSFVADWFIDVGGYLQNMEAALASGVSFKRGYVTELYYSNLGETVYWDPSDVKFEGSFRVSKSGVISNRKFEVWKKRTKLSALPFPRAPKFEARLGWQRIVSAAALIRVILLGGVKGRKV